MKMLKGALQWSVYPQRTGSKDTKRSMYAGTHFTDPGRMENWVNFSGKEGRPNIQPLTRTGIEPGTSGLGGRDLYHCANPSATKCIHKLLPVSLLFISTEQGLLLKRVITLHPLEQIMAKSVSSSWVRLFGIKLMKSLKIFHWNHLNRKWKNHC